MNLVQGDMSVREYEREFSRLRRYVFYGQEDEKAMIRNFLHGLRPELGSRLSVVEYTSLNKLIETAVNVEVRVMAEKEAGTQGTGGSSGGPSASSSQKAKGKQVVTQGRGNPRARGQAKRGGGGVRIQGGSGVCYTCGQFGHYSKDCPNDGGFSKPPVRADVTCWSCGKKGHYSTACPTPQAPRAPQVNRPPPAREEGEQPAKRQNLGGRVYALEVDDPKPPGPAKGPIAGTLHVGGNPTHVLFDSGATHSFVSPEVAAKFAGALEVDSVSVSVATPGNQTLRAESRIRSVPVAIEGKTFLADLLVVPLQGFEVILGMDWLSGYQAQLDCGRGRVIFEERGKPRLSYYRISPSTTVSLVSAL